mmetsp:Transcript_4396/g.7244  ORF Transcript_4396/g.7244 Transcript_4396/m.7244 type:complete len:222 (-) Transcript_4396:585-1250(-)
MYAAAAGWVFPSRAICPIECPGLHEFQSRCGGVAAAKTKVIESRVPNFGGRGRERMARQHQRAQPVPATGAVRRHGGAVRGPLRHVTRHGRPVAQCGWRAGCGDDGCLRVLAQPAAQHPGVRVHQLHGGLRNGTQAGRGPCADACRGGCGHSRRVDATAHRAGCVSGQRGRSGAVLAMRLQDRGPRPPVEAVARVASAALHGQGLLQATRLAGYVLTSCMH